ncbi:hypothetical protein [Mesorhizobium sp. 1B3]|uniref:hypothetical protein n=1 Tax=Mesorhizobium sp. 1B3 TaxID=3243599 RepID=UPI003D96EAF9
MQDAIKSLIDACKGHHDLLAFIGIGILTAAVAISTASVTMTIAFPMIMGVLWVGSRYALFKLQSQERLRDMRHRALENSQRVLDKRVSDEELDLIVWSRKNTEGNDER